PSTIDEGPVYERPYARPQWQDELQQVPEIARPESLVQALKDMVSSPALSSREFITDQYDRYVRGNTVKAKQSDSGVLRINEETYCGVAISANSCSGYTNLYPNIGARFALAEAYRIVAVNGARPYTVTNCLY